VVGLVGPLLAQRLEDPPADAVLVLFRDADETNRDHPPGAAGVGADDLGLGLHAAVLECDRQIELRPRFGGCTEPVELGAETGLAEVDGLAPELDRSVLRYDRDGDAAADGLATLAGLGRSGDAHPPADDGT